MVCKFKIIKCSMSRSTLESVSDEIIESVTYEVVFISMKIYGCMALMHF